MAISEFILILFMMVGRLPNPFIGPVVNAGISGLEFFINHAFLVRLFIHGFGLAGFLFFTRFGIGFGRIFHFNHDYLDVTLLESLRSKFLKLVGIHLDPL